MQTSTLRRALLAATLLALTTAASAQTLLVVNQGDSTLSLVDPHTFQQTATIPEQTPNVHAHEAAASADGRFAFLPIYGSAGVGKPGIDGHEVLTIDLRSHQIVGHFDFSHPVRPHLPTLDPASGLLYVSTELDNSISIFDPRDPAHLKLLGAIPTGQAQSHMFALSHDGRRAYTANVGPGTVSVLDIPRRKTLAIIPISSDTQRISISADDKLVFTADQTQPRLAVIDTATNKLKTWVPLPGLAYGTAATPDGRWLIVTVRSTNQVALVDLHSLQVTRTLDVPPAPQEVILSPDAKFAYVSCNTSAKVAVVDLTHWTVSSLIQAGKLADGLAWAK